VVSGMVARYHLLGNGGRQYLAYHLAGDLPDFQALFLREMDHGVCAVGPAIVAFIPHKMIMEAFNRSPSLGFAMWRETLIDARSSAKRSRTTAPGRSLSGWPICSANCSIVRGRPD
jgi:CRP-like cAMP-binding protein